MKRNSMVEVYRCLMMLGICTLHVINHLGDWSWAESLLTPCVCGFAVISGWFGIKCSLSKIIKLYFVQAWCGAIVLIIMQYTVCVWGGGGFVDWMRGFWFIHAYVLMMLLSPMVDVVLEYRRVAIVPLFIAVFGWGWLSNFPVIHSYVPKTHGLEMFSGLALLGSYAATRIVRITGIYETVSRATCLVVFLVVLGIMGPLHLGQYNSPLAFLAALSLFLLFWKSDSASENYFVLNILCKFCAIVSPSVFAVYFLHMSAPGLSGLLEVTRFFLDYNMPIYLAAPIGAMTMFVICILVDCPRRIVMRFALGRLFIAQIFHA